jgi:micrococcal nuclease
MGKRGKTKGRKGQDLLKASEGGEVYDRYERNARVMKIVDGDTLELMVDLAFEHWYQGKFRLVGINTPEVYGVKKESEEYQLGKAASAYALQWMLDNGGREVIESPLGPIEFIRIVIRSFDSGKGKYGRWICEVFKADGSGESLNMMLVEAGHAELVNY